MKILLVAAPTASEIELDKPRLGPSRSDFREGMYWNYYKKGYAKDTWWKLQEMPPHVKSKLLYQNYHSHHCTSMVYLSQGELA